MNKPTAVVLFVLLLTGCASMSKNTSALTPKDREVAVVAEYTGSNAGECKPRVIPDYACSAGVTGAGPEDICVPFDKKLTWRLFGFEESTAFSVSFKPTEDETEPNPFQSCGYKHGNKFDSKERIIECKTKKKADLPNKNIHVFAYAVDISVCNEPLDPRIFISGS